MWNSFSMAIGNVELIQHGYRKCGTHALVFSQKLAHGISKNEIRETEEVGKMRRVNMEKVQMAGEKKKYDGVAVTQPGRYSPKKWRNFPTNLTNTATPTILPQSLGGQTRGRLYIINVITLYITIVKPLISAQ